MHLSQNNSDPIGGILLVNKERGRTSFSLVGLLRRILNVKKIGHAGTLDPFATGVMVMLVGRDFTRLSDQLLCEDKEYVAKMRLGFSTDTYDCEGKTIQESPYIPSLEEFTKALEAFQGEITQVPPMFSAKKIAGKKLYEYARKGQEIPRKAAKIKLETILLSYDYPYATLKVKCSKGTYIRSIAHDLGQNLGCGAHLVELHRTRSGSFHVNDCIDSQLMMTSSSEALRQRFIHPHEGFYRT